MSDDRFFLKVLILFSTGLLLISGGALAGGGANWKVNIKNNTEYKSRVCISLDKLTSVEWVEWRTIQPGGSTTFETGSMCPCSVMGEVFDPQTQSWKATRAVNLGLGNEIEDEAFCSAACWNSFWKICRKVGVATAPVKDKDFSFCKY